MNLEVFLDNSHIYGGFLPQLFSHRVPLSVLEKMVKPLLANAGRGFVSSRE